MRFQSSVLTLFLGLLYSVSFAVAEVVGIDVAMMDFDNDSRDMMVEIGRDFERKNPGYRVRFTFLRDAPYKENIEGWLQEGNHDVFYWQAGERLNRFARQDWLKPLNSLWEDNDLDPVFSAGTRDLVSYDGNIVAIPYSFQHWGIYYRISLFRRLNLNPPKTWEEMLHSAEILKKNGVKPFIIATKYQWPSVAWFSHLNLRINGIGFHRELMSGRVAYTDSRVLDVFEKWKYLLDREYFIDNPQEYSSKEALEPFYSTDAAMYLTGNFVTQYMNKALLSDIGYIRFPTVDPDIPKYEELPLDVFVMPKNARNPAASEKFLLHMAGAISQEKINKAQLTLPANRQSEIADDRFVRYGLQILSEARDVSLFYDRETDKTVSKIATVAMSEFLHHRDIARVTAELEQARTSAYGPLQAVSRTLRVGFYERPPFQWIDSEGKPAGLDIELMQLIASESAYTLDFQEYPWNRIVSNLRAGELDIALSAAPLPERQMYAHFSSESFRLGHNALFVGNELELGNYGSETLKRFLDSGYTLAVRRGVSYSDEYQRLLMTGDYEGQLHVVNDDQQSINLLLKKRVQGFLMSEFSGLDEVRKRCLHNRIRFLSYLSDDEDALSYLMMSKKSVSEAMVKDINAAMARLKANGAYQKVIDKYRLRAPDTRTCLKLNETGQ